MQDNRSNTTDSMQDLQNKLKELFTGYNNVTSQIERQNIQKNIIDLCAANKGNQDFVNFVRDFVESKKQDSSIDVLFYGQINNVLNNTVINQTVNYNITGGNNNIGNGNTSTVGSNNNNGNTDYGYNNQIHQNSHNGVLPNQQMFASSGNGIQIAGGLSSVAQGVLQPEAPAVGVAQGVSQSEVPAVTQSIFSKVKQFVNERLNVSGVSADTEKKINVSGNRVGGSINKEDAHKQLQKNYFKNQPEAPAVGVAQEKSRVSGNRVGNKEDAHKQLKNRVSKDDSSLIKPTDYFKKDTKEDTSSKINNTKSNNVNGATSRNEWIQSMRGQVKTATQPTVKASSSFSGVKDKPNTPSLEAMREKLKQARIDRELRKGSNLPPPSNAKRPTEYKANNVHGLASLRASSGLSPSGVPNTPHVQLGGMGR